MKTITIPVPSMPKNWKTTLMGMLTAGAYATKTMVLTGQFNWTDAAITFGIAALGYLVKDKDVTGGTVAATPEAQARLDASPKPADQPAPSTK
jgi:hypothetical protein